MPGPLFDFAITVTYVIVIVNFLKAPHTLTSGELDRQGVVKWRG